MFFMEPTMFAPSLSPVHNANKEKMTSVPQTGFSHVMHRLLESEALGNGALGAQPLQILELVSPASHSLFSLSFCQASTQNHLRP